jgi:hypothetical protein
VTEALLQSLIASHWNPSKDKAENVEAIGVRSDTRWQGPDQVVLGHMPIEVFQCDSVLHVRETLNRKRSGPVVFITTLPITVLGTDVESRLLRHRLLEVEPWDLLRVRFNARVFDAGLHGKTALAKAAAETLGTTNPDPSPTGVLTAEAAWKVVLDGQLGLKEARPDVRRWLEWARQNENVMRWRVLPPELKDLLREWMESYLSDWATTFLACLDSGYGGMGLALGFAMSVLRHPVEDSAGQVALAQSLVRLERFVGGTSLSPRAQQGWSEAAEQWASARVAEGQFSEVSSVLTEAEDILEKVNALGHAIHSNWLRASFVSRLGVLAKSIDNLAMAESALKAMETHFLPRWSKKESVWLGRAKMAVRLSRWLSSAEGRKADWLSMVESYQADGSWVDAARQALMAGDEPEFIHNAWTALVGRATERRERENLQFAKALTEVTARGFADAAVPVEQILDRFVAPLAKDRVLLIVMDGMSFAVWRELGHEITQNGGWTSCSRQEGKPLPPGLSAIPSITTVSRCSLLSGRLAQGLQPVEKAGFADHPGLLAASRSVYPPILFHKDEVGVGAANIADSVRKEIRSPNRRVVGVVLNVIDDSLTGPEQRVFRWDLDQIPIFRTLLSEARDADRTVVLTSDHGHTLDRGAVMRRQAKTDRYREPDGTLSPDEMLVSGTRVVTDSRSCVALATELIRYSSVRKLGYHGGITPQECLVPIVVLTSNDKVPEGWQQAGDPPPSWWYPNESIPAAKPIAKKNAKTRSKDVGPLLQGVAPIESDWIERLMSSEVLKTQRQVGGAKLEVEKLETAVRILARRDGVLLKSAFASQMNLPLFRIDGFLSNLQRVLNVDGYQILSVDSSQTIRLDIALLKTQFSLPLGD